MGGFEAFYASSLQQPFLLWAAALAGAAVAFSRRDLDSALRRYCAALTALSLCDAWLTANHVLGIGALTGRAAAVVPLGFVLAGDFRYLLLLGIGTAAGGLDFRAGRVVAALGLTLIVPLLSHGITSLPGAAEAGPRLLYFVYEALFCLLGLALLRWHPGPRALPWLRRVTHFVLLYYALWAAADAILLATGSDLGYGLRVVPNVLYYGGLVAAIGQAGAAAATRARTRARGA